jgi:hypothetical protein
MANRTIRTDRARDIFLKTLAATCNVTRSARRAGMGRSAAYDWRSDDAEFAKAWDEAIESAADRLEEVAFRRGTTGKSDRMLEILLKGHRPKYRDKAEVDLRHNLSPEAAEWLGIKQHS